MSPIHLRPDFEAEYEDWFVKAFESYHKCLYEKAGDLVDIFLSQDHSIYPLAAPSSFNVLNQLIRWHTPYKWTGPTVKDWSNSVHIEDTIASLAHCAREWLYCGLETESGRKKTLDDFLLFALGEVREHVIMPPDEGAVVSDVKVCSTRLTSTSNTAFLTKPNQIIGKIIYHSILTSSNVPKGDKKWIKLKKDENIMFQHLCAYLLNTARLELLVLALDFRSSASHFDKTYKRNTIDAALKIASDYQSIRLELLAETAEIVLEYHHDPKFHSFYRLESVHFRSFHLGSYQRNTLVFDKDTEFSLQSYQTRLEKGEWFGGTQFFDHQILQKLFWRAATERVFFHGKHQTARRTLYDTDTNASNGIPPFNALARDHACRYKYNEPCFYASCFFDYSQDSSKAPSWTFNLREIHDTIRNCSSCYSTFDSLRRLELLAGKDGFAAALNGTTICTPLDVRITLEQPETPKLCVLDKSMMVGLLYLESTFRSQVASPNRHIKTPDVAKFLLECLELWFTPLLFIDGTTEAMPYLKNIADKLAFCTCLWLSMSDQDQLERKSISRCVYHLLQLAFHQTESDSQHTLRIALRLCIRFLRKAQETGTRYDVFELSFFGSLVVASIDEKSRPPDSSNFLTQLEVCLGESKSLRTGNQSTDFPDIAWYYANTTEVEYLPPNFIRSVMRYKLKLNVQIHQLYRNELLEPRSKFRRLEIYAPYLNSVSRHTQADSLKAIASWDTSIRLQRKDIPKSNLSWFRWINVDKEGSISFDYPPKFGEPKPQEAATYRYSMCNKVWKRPYIPKFVVSDLKPVKSSIMSRHLY